MFVIEFYIRSQGFEGHEQYLQATRMNKPGVWATDIEIYTLLHLLNTPIVVSAHMLMVGWLGEILSVCYADWYA